MDAKYKFLSLTEPRAKEYTISGEEGPTTVITYPKIQWLDAAKTKGRVVGSQFNTCWLTNVKGPCNNDQSLVFDLLRDTVKDYDVEIEVNGANIIYPGVDMSFPLEFRAKAFKAGTTDPLPLSKYTDGYIAVNSAELGYFTNQRYDPVTGDFLADFMMNEVNENDSFGVTSVNIPASDGNSTVMGDFEFKWVSSPRDGYRVEKASRGLPFQFTLREDATRTKPLLAIEGPSEIIYGDHAPMWDLLTYERPSGRPSDGSTIDTIAWSVSQNSAVVGLLPAHDVNGDVLSGLSVKVDVNTNIPDSYDIVRRTTDNVTPTTFYDHWHFTIRAEVTWSDATVTYVTKSVKVVRLRVTSFEHHSSYIEPGGTELFGAARFIATIKAEDGREFLTGIERMYMKDCMAIAQAWNPTNPVLEEYTKGEHVQESQIYANVFDGVTDNSAEYKMLIDAELNTYFFEGETRIVLEGDVSHRYETTTLPRAFVQYDWLEHHRDCFYEGDGDGIMINVDIQSESQIPLGSTQFVNLPTSSYTSPNQRSDEPFKPVPYIYCVPMWTGSNGITVDPYTGQILSNTFGNPATREGDVQANLSVIYAFPRASRGLSVPITFKGLNLPVTATTSSQTLAPGSYRITYDFSVDINDYNFVASAFTVSSGASISSLTKVNNRQYTLIVSVAAGQSNKSVTLKPGRIYSRFNIPCQTVTVSGMNGAVIAPTTVNGIRFGLTPIGTLTLGAINSYLPASGGSGVTVFGTTTESGTAVTNGNLYNNMAGSGRIPTAIIPVSRGGNYRFWKESTPGGAQGSLHQQEFFLIESAITINGESCNIWRGQASETNGMSRYWTIEKV